MKLTWCVAAGMFFLAAGCAKMTEDQLWQKVEQSEKNNNADSTILMCQTILKEYPDGKDASAALYKLGEVYQDKKHEYQTAIRYYNTFVEKYPDLNSTPVAMFVTAFIYNNNLQMTDSARVAYLRFLAKFPQHELAASAKFELDNLGRTPDEIIGIKKEVATDSKKPSKKK